LFLAIASPAFANPAHIPAGIGATLPFITHEAESSANTLSGSGARVVSLTFPPARVSSPAQEASGCAFVELTATGDTLEIPVTAPSDSIVIRHCIPDSEKGGGIRNTLTLLINGKPRQSLALSSRHNWLYGAPGQNGQSNIPTPDAPGGAHVFWDETRAIVEGPAFQPGDKLRLRKTTADTAAFYRIDLVDLELAGPPLPPPPEGTFLSVLDHGAKGDGVTDDTAAIAVTIAAARQQNKTVWLPAGTYVQTARFTLDGPVAVRGAGMWHTRILGTRAGNTWAGTMGFHLTGDGPSLSGFYMESTVPTSRSGGAKPVTGNARNWRAERLWITHTDIGLWMSGAAHGVVRDCRIRFTYADGINLNRGASHNLVENNHVRGCGDDGIAFLSETRFGDPPSVGNIARHNTITCTWWGQNMDLAGGRDHVMENNYLADNALMALFTINMTGAFPNHPVSRSVFRDNLLVRGGGITPGKNVARSGSTPGTTRSPTSRFPAIASSIPRFAPSIWPARTSNMRPSPAMSSSFPDSRSPAMWTWCTSTPESPAVAYSGTTSPPVSPPDVPPSTTAPRPPAPSKNPAIVGEGRGGGGGEGEVTGRWIPPSVLRRADPRMRPTSAALSQPAIARRTKANPPAPARDAVVSRFRSACVFIVSLQISMVPPA
jgi:hypothetical protein